VRVVTNLLLQFVAVVVTAISWVPQAWWGWRSADTHGISVSSWGLGAGTGMVFCLYGLRSGVWSLALSEGAFALGAGLVVAVVVGWSRVIPSVLGAVLASIIIVLVASPTEIALLGIAGSLGMRLLQLVRTWHTKSTAGMSRTAWVLLLVNVLAWGVFGWRTGRWPLVVTSAIVVASAVALLIVVGMVKRGEDTTPVAGEL
jgi:uncharacterized protein with PQ loop repeat